MPDRGRRVVRPEYRRSERARQRLQLLQITRRLAEQEIEVDGSDRCPLERRSRVAYQHCVEPDRLQLTGDFRQVGLGVHHASIVPP